MTELSTVFEFEIIFDVDCNSFTDRETVINSQAYLDYETFIESVQDLCLNYYDFGMYYKNQPNDYSFYCSIVAKTSINSLIFLDFAFIFRSNEISIGTKVQPSLKAIVVNGAQFDDYFDAYLALDALLKQAIE